MSWDDSKHINYYIILESKNVTVHNIVEPKPVF
jgi:hypothetical protein